MFPRKIEEGNYILVNTKKVKVLLRNISLDKFSTYFQRFPPLRALEDYPQYVPQCNIKSVELTQRTLTSKVNTKLSTKHPPEQSVQLLESYPARQWPMQFLPHSLTLNDRTIV